MGTIALFAWRHKAFVFTVLFSGLVEGILLASVVSWDVMGLALLFKSMLTCMRMCLHEYDDVTPCYRRSFLSAWCAWSGQTVFRCSNTVHWQV